MKKKTRTAQKYMQGEQENFKMNPRTDATNTSACTATRVCNNSTAASRTPCNVTIIYWSVPEENNFKLRSFWEKRKKKKKTKFSNSSLWRQVRPPTEFQHPTNSSQQLIWSNWPEGKKEGSWGKGTKHEGCCTSMHLVATTFISVQPETTISYIGWGLAISWHLYH